MIGEIRQNFTEASASVGLILATALKIIDLARAKSEALVYSLFKQNIKSCNAKRRRHATPESDEKQQ